MVFMVVREEQTAKAHVCLDCFEELSEVPGGTVESVSLQITRRRWRGESIWRIRRLRGPGVGGCNDQEAPLSSSFL